MLDRRIAESLVLPTEVDDLVAVLAGFYRSVTRIELDAAEHLARFQREQAVSREVLLRRPAGAGQRRISLERRRSARLGGVHRRIRPRQDRPGGCRRPQRRPGLAARRHRTRHHRRRLSAADGEGRGSSQGEEALRRHAVDEFWSHQALTVRKRRQRAVRAASGRPLADCRAGRPAQYAGSSRGRYRRTCPA